MTLASNITACASLADYLTMPDCAKYIKPNTSSQHGHQKLTLWSETMHMAAAPRHCCGSLHDCPLQRETHVNDVRSACPIKDQHSHHQKNHPGVSLVASQLVVGLRAQDLCDCLPQAVALEGTHVGACWLTELGLRHT